MGDEIEDLPGVGPAVGERLRDAGYDTFLAIAVAPPSLLSEQAGVGHSVAVKIVNAARGVADVGGFKTGNEIMEERKNVRRISTGSAELDKLLGGGVESQSITEFFSSFGSGKTQLAHQLSVNVQTTTEPGKVLYIDTEGTFRPDRVESMASAAGQDPKQILDNIHVARAFSSHHQMLLLDKAHELPDVDKIQLIIVDSLTSHFRAEYVGRGQLANRQAKLNTHIHALQKFAIAHNAAAVVTNQVMAKPDAMFGNPAAPIGGHIVGHASTFRIYLRRSKGDKRIARLIDSPNLPDGEAVFKVTKDGVCDA